MAKAKFEGSQSGPSIDFFEADFRDSQTMSAMLCKYSRPLGASRISGVVHFAAFKAVSESIQYPLRYYANNVASLIDFCALLADSAIKTFILSSSATVYGDLANKGGKFSEDYYTQQSYTGLMNLYGRTKWICEAILSDLAKSDPEWKIFALRYFNPVGCDESGLIGKDPRGTPNNLMPVLVQAVTDECPTLDIFGSNWDTVDGTAIRDFIHVSDLARGHIAALKTAHRNELSGGFQVFNLETGNGQTVKEVIMAIGSIIGRQIPTKTGSKKEWRSWHMHCRYLEGREDVGLEGEEDDARQLSRYCTILEARSRREMSVAIGRSVVMSNNALVPVQ